MLEFYQSLDEKIFVNPGIFWQVIDSYNIRYILVLIILNCLAGPVNLSTPVAIPLFEMSVQKFSESIQDSYISFILLIFCAAVPAPVGMIPAVPNPGVKI